MSVAVGIEAFTISCSNLGCNASFCSCQRCSTIIALTACILKPKIHPQQDILNKELKLVCTSAFHGMHADKVLVDNEVIINPSDAKHKLLLVRHVSSFICHYCVNHSILDVSGYFTKYSENHNIEHFVLYIR